MRLSDVLAVSAGIILPFGLVMLPLGTANHMTKLIVVAGLLAIMLASGAYRVVTH